MQMGVDKLRLAALFQALAFTNTRQVALTVLAQCSSNAVSSGSEAWSLCGGRAGWAAKQGPVQRPARPSLPGGCMTGPAQLGHHMVSCKCEACCEWHAGRQAGQAGRQGPDWGL